MNLWKWQNVGKWLQRQSLASRKVSRRRNRGFSPSTQVLEVRALLSTLTVTTLNDTVANDGQLSLREALTVANNAGQVVDGVVSNDVADTIVFSNSLNGTVSLQSGQLQISNSVAIDGDCDITIDAHGASRIFDISAGSVTLDGLTLLNGSVSANGGGAIRTSSAAGLTINDTTISGSVAAGVSGGAILATSGNLTIQNSTLSLNATTGANADGGAIAFSSATGTLRLTNATLSGNFTTADDADGGAVYLADGNLMATNSTIALNDAGGVGGGVNATLADSVTIHNSIVATNTDSGTAPDLAALSASISNSLIGIDGGATLTVGSGSANLIGSVALPIDPLLAPLADNGGCVQTHALLAGSVAIDAGSSAFTVGLSTDARGIGFLRTDGRVDLGAFEVQAGIAVAPQNILPAPLQLIQNTPLTFSAGLGTQLAVSDPSAGGKTIQVTLVSTAGTLALSQTTGLSFTAGSNGSASMTIRGTLADINSALEGSVFTPTLDALGAASVHMTTSDLALGGDVALTLTDDDTLAITLVAPGTSLAPVITAPTAVQANAGSTLVLSAANGSVISVADLDAAGSDLRVTIGATHGTLTLATTAGLTFSTGDGTDDDTLVFTGTVAEINAALAGLQFNPAPAYTGPAQISIGVNDQAGVGDPNNGNALAATQNITVTVNTPNLAPTVTLPGVTSVVAGTSLVLGVDLGGNWTKVGAPGGTSPSIIQAGDQLLVTNKAGVTTAATLSVINGVTTITFANGVTGTVVSGTTINWSTGDQWTRASASTANDLVIGDADAGSSLVVVELAATNATLTLSQTTGLIFITGDGTTDATMRFTGTLAAVNAALKGAVFTPTLASTATGEAALQVSVNDQAVSGAASADQVLSLDVTANMSGTWFNARGKPTSIVQVGDQLLVKNAAAVETNGPAVRGHITSSGQFVVDGWSGLVANFSSNAQINFANGTIWTRPISPPALAVNWQNASDVHTSIVTDGSTLTFTNAAGQSTTGYFIADNKVVIPAWGANGYLKGTISSDGLTINFNNGAVWTVDASVSATSDDLLTLSLKPLDINLLGLEIDSSPITVTISTAGGDGKLLGNLLDVVSTLVDTDQINAALNNVLGTTVDLLNSIGLEVAGVGGGVFTNATESLTEIAHITVAPVHLDLLGAQVDTSPIELVINARAGSGLVLGNVLTALTDLFNPPLPEDGINLADINTQLTQLLSDLNSMIPGIPSATVPPPVLEPGEILEVTVPAIDLNLLGLNLETSPITVEASAASGDGLLLGNILTVVLNTLDATPEELNDLSANINNVLAKVIGVLNASTLTLPPSAITSLSDTLQSLALPDLVTAAPGSTTDILDLVINSTDGVTPPVQVDLLGVHVETSDIDAKLTATTGDGQVLGNLLYNVANLMNPGGPAGLISLITDLAAGVTSPSSPLPAPGSSSSTTGPTTTLLTVNLPPIDLDLLGLSVQTGTITVTVSAQQGDGNLLGNALTGISTLINTQGVSDALNNVLQSTVNLLNSVDLEVAGVLDGTFSSGDVSQTQILHLFVAPVHLDLLGAQVDTSPIELTITAHTGEGLVLGNVLTALTDLFNPPLPDALDLDFINSRLEQLLADLGVQLPGIPTATVPPVTLADGQILNLTVPAIDLNLLGLMLDTSPITVNATANTGDGLLLGNLLTTVLDTVNATPEQLTALNTNLNNLLAKVIGVLNASTLTLPGGVLGSLSAALQTLALPTLLTNQFGATSPILDLTIASTDGTTPPVIVDLLGVHITTSDIDAHLSAQTGDGQILGNLVYNVSHLLDPNSPAALLFLLTQLGA